MAGIAGGPFTTRRMHLYAIKYLGEPESVDHRRFALNAQFLRGKAVEPSGRNTAFLVAHAKDPATVAFLCAQGLQERKDVSIAEVSGQTLRPGGEHHAYKAIVDQCFLPSVVYPHVR